MSCTEEKRADYISWDQYFMGVAKLSAMRSKDPSTQVGSCIIESTTNKIISIGYNGMPRGCNDDDFPWGKKREKIQTSLIQNIHLLYIVRQML
ncbi:deoxycytidylate deaminase, partial [Emiliania huxleyi virus 208]